jgi:hypothetical protein
MPTAGHATRTYRDTSGADHRASQRAPVGLGITKRPLGSVGGFLTECFAAPTRRSTGCLS